MTAASPDVALESLGRRMRAMHSLWYDAVASMDLSHVNHVERSEVLPIAFSLFHLAQIEDGSFMALSGELPLYDDSWGDRMGLAIRDHGKERTPAEMTGQRIQGYAAFREYQRQVFTRTESWLADLDPSELARVVVPRPLPAVVASTFSARVAGDEGITVLDGIECWIYQHGLRHMGEVEHARALVGLKGMTS
jgi:hypothetical protein